MLCAISGEAPTVPVISSKSGNVFEKRLIETYIAEHGKDPVTGEDLTVEDLIEVKSPRIVKPRPPTLTSIPSLLQVFQNEWDALALETFTLQQQLAQTRQELSTALYQHDAAVRVISRLLKERDEAREALSKVSIGAPAPADGDAMQVDGETLPDNLKEKVTETHARLTSTRTKRPVPAEWVTAELLGSFDQVSTSEPIYPGGKFIALDESSELALVGGADGVAGIFSLANNDLVSTLKADNGSVTAGLWRGQSAITAYSSGVVRVWDNSGNSTATISSHAGEVTALDLHPSKDILGSVGADKSWILYDIDGGRAVTQVRSDAGFASGVFQPDGHLFAGGTTDSSIQIFDVRSLEKAAEFQQTSSAPVQSLAFSENGYMLAASSKGDSTVAIWDLRYGTNIKTLDFGSRVDAISWEYSARFLAGIGPAGITVHSYNKKGKVWSEVLRKAQPGVALTWGKNAKSLVSLSADGAITVTGAQ